MCLVSLEKILCDKIFFFREMGKNPPVREDPPAPALTALWAVTAAIHRPALHRPTADQVRLHFRSAKIPFL